MCSTEYETDKLRDSTSCFALQQTKFFTTTTNLENLPTDNLAEIAFIGRSNAGKSTSINILCHQRRLAFTSKTPGRTQNINYFSVHSKEKKIGYLVDLPGYGFATVPIKIKKEWEKLLNNYLQYRENIRGIILLIDSRRPPSLLDVKMINWILSTTEKPIHILLTKSDKLNRQQSILVLAQIKKIIQDFRKQQYDVIECNSKFNIQEKKNYGQITVQLFSALRRIGINEATNKILGWLNI